MTSRRRAIWCASRLAFDQTLEHHNAIGRIIEFGVPISVFNLNSFTSTTALDVALDCFERLRPDPTRAQIEQLASIGNSFYHGLTLELRTPLSSQQDRFWLFVPRRLHALAPD